MEYIEKLEQKIGRLKKYDPTNTKYIADLEKQMEELKLLAPLDPQQYFTIYQELDKLIDLYISTVSESNRDFYLIGEIHITNMHNLLKPFNDFLLEDIVKDQKPQKIHINFIEDPKKQGPILASQSRTSFRAGSAIVDVASVAAAGEETEELACDGKMLLPESHLFEGYLVAGISKTYDELLHDFNKSDALSSHMTELKKIYEPVIEQAISHFHADDEKSENIRYKPELDKILKFIDKLHDKATSGQEEWKYYTSALEYIDVECNKLEELTFVKVTKLNAFKFMTGIKEMLQRKHFLITFDKQINNKQTNNTTEDNDAGDYFYSKIDNTPINPLFDISDISLRFSDNSTAIQKLYPLIYDVIPDKTDNKREISNELITNFTNTLYDIKYAPGLLDSKTIGHPNLNTFTENNKDLTNLPDDKNKEYITRIQQLQNLNNPYAYTARRIMIDGINAFIQYFLEFPFTQKLIDHQDIIVGRDTDYIKTELQPELYPESLAQQINFVIIEETKGKGKDKEINNLIYGVSFILQPYSVGDILIASSETIIIFTGDTTIQNISKFVNKYRGNIPNILPPVEKKDSWIRLHTFALAIYNRSTIGKNLTEIIISLKSFGDSLQVYYSKRMGLILSQLNLNLYISSTDKNVGGESLFLNSLVLLNGTGIRPHSRFYNEYINFFGKQSFEKYITESSDESISPEDDDRVTCKMIVTNISNINEDKCFIHLIEIFKKFSEPLPPNTEAFIKKGIKFPEDLTSHKDILELIKNVLINKTDDSNASISTNNNIFNTLGNEHLIKLFENIYDTYLKQDTINSSTDNLEKKNNDLKVVNIDICNHITILCSFLTKVIDIIKHYEEELESTVIDSLEEKPISTRNPKKVLTSEEKLANELRRLSGGGKKVSKLFIAKIEGMNELLFLQQRVALEGLANKNQEFITKQRLKILTKDPLTMSERLIDADPENTYTNINRSMDVFINTLNKQNIFDDNFLSFASEYLNNDYVEVLHEINRQYLEIISKSKLYIKSMYDDYLKTRTAVEKAFATREAKITHQSKFVPFTAEQIYQKIKTSSAELETNPIANIITNINSSKNALLELLRIYKHDVVFNTDDLILETESINTSDKLKTIIGTIQEQLASASSRNIVVGSDRKSIKKIETAEYEYILNLQKLNSFLDKQVHIYTKIDYTHPITSFEAVSAIILGVYTNLHEIEVKLTPTLKVDAAKGGKNKTIKTKKYKRNKKTKKGKKNKTRKSRKYKTKKGKGKGKGIKKFTRNKLNIKQ
jgi:hypothetical protein